MERSPSGRQRSPASCAASAAEALHDLHGLYAALARQHRSLLAALPGVGSATAWQHFPEADARDDGAGYRWYYHCHGPSEAVPIGEHGHIHLFAAEQRGGRTQALRHLVAVGLRPNGLPCRLFTVNGWVTGDAPRSARWTLRRLSALQLETGYDEIDRFLVALCRLYRPALPRLLHEAEERLRAAHAIRSLAVADRSLELLSSLEIDLDRPPLAA